jgi:hypothetical protein
VNNELETMWKKSGVGYCKTIVSLKALSKAIDKLSQNSRSEGRDSKPVFPGNEAVILFGHYLK